MMLAQKIQHESKPLIATDELSTLDPEELRSRLTKLCEEFKFKQYKKAAAPILYWLREKVKAKGKKGQGFGAWVDANLDISRDTADRWADAYAISIGKEPLGKTPKGRADKNGEICLKGHLPPAYKQEDWDEDVKVLGGLRKLWPTFVEFVKQQAKEKRQLKTATRGVQ